MTTTLPTIDFWRIRAHDGSQHGGFEQLAVELFARSLRLPRQTVRVHGAGGDGGVEAFAIEPGRGKLGIQAKYLDRLLDTQWRQIDQSVRTALEQHPDLVEYRVCVPLDRTSGRRGRSQGQLNKWNQLVEVWHSLPNGANVAFVWEGQHEIGLALKRAANHDLLHYWFGAQQFDDAWLEQLLQASLQTLGERYQPRRHVEPSVGRLLEGIMWAPSFERATERAYLKFAEACTKYVGTLANISIPDGLPNQWGKLASSLDEAVRAEYPKYSTTSVRHVCELVEPVLVMVNELSARLRAYVRTRNREHERTLEYEYYQANSFGRVVAEWLSHLKEHGDADLPCAFISGEAGSGKSHLLAHAAVKARANDRKQPVLLVLGESFLDSRPPLVQLCEQIGWSGGSASLLSALNVAGSLANRPAVLLVDAVNESTERRLWKSHLHAVASEVRKYAHVRLVVSCRTDFVTITMPTEFKAGVPGDWGQLQHYGFGDVMFEAVSRYFESYKVRSPHFPPLLDEFRNPLFLDTYCKAFEGQDVPEGPVALKAVMERRVARLAEKIGVDIGCDEYDVRQAISDLAEKVRAQGGRAVPKSTAREAIDKYSPSAELNRSLYTHLLSNKVIIERIERPWEEEPTIVVRFAFERFSDYFIARGLLTGITSVSSLRDALGEGGRLEWVRSREGYLEGRGVAAALSILLPDQFGLELVDLLPEVEHHADLLWDVLDSLPWRTAASIQEGTKRRIIEASRDVGTERFIAALLRLSTIPGHPFNARYLHQRLATMTLPMRDAVWTLGIGQSDTARTLVEWAIQVPRDLVSSAQAVLVATILLWFGSSNRVNFRARSGLAAIRLLRGRPEVMRDLVGLFDEVNDPYVVERLYAVACGVAMREPAGEGLRELALTVHGRVFATRSVRAHVLLREYAQTVLDLAAHRGCLDPSITVGSFSPPFQSAMPLIEADVKRLEADERWRDIVWSVRPESMGGYGDFGRYVLGSAVHNFLSATLHEPVPKDSYKQRFNDQIAARWVLQRVMELGWTPELFGEHDRNQQDARLIDREYKIERIGKKYQWIALHELLGYLADNHHLAPQWGDDTTTFAGAWQIDVRDFDPSIEPVMESAGVEEDSDEGNEIASVWSYTRPYPDPFVDHALLSDRARWVAAPPENPQSLLAMRRRDDPRQWVALNGFWQWNEPRIVALRHGWDGRAEMWLHARSWLVAKQDADQFVRRISALSLWGHGCWGVALGEGWIGEYPHGRSFESVRRRCEEPDKWTAEDACLHISTTCNWDGKGGPIVPSPHLCELLPARWSGEGAVFVDVRGDLVCAAGRPPQAADTGLCVVVESELRACLNRANVQVVWAIVGERRCWNGTRMVGGHVMHFSGVYRLGDSGPQGDLTVVEIVPHGNDSND